MSQEELVGGTRRRLYLKEVAGRGPGPRRRGGAVGAQPRTRKAGRKHQVQIDLNPPNLLYPRLI
jgi:hypothetical protein